MKSSVLILACVVMVTAGLLALQRKAAPLTVWVFDVGQGDAIFIDGPARQVLVDGGPDSAVLEKLGAVMLPWDRTIDTVILTHPHADHVYGLNAVLERYHVAATYSTREPYGEPPAEAFAAHAQQPLAHGGVIDLGDGATLKALWPPASLEGIPSTDPNDGSIVFLLTYGETSILLTGDAGVAEEEQFALAAGNVDILKVGHHGSDTSTGPLLVNLTDPEIAIISVGEGNSYGHPSSEVLWRFENAGVRVVRTDVDGDVRIRSAGGEPSVAVFDL